MGAVLSSEVAEGDAADDRDSKGTGATAEAVKRNLLDISARGVGPERNGLYQVPLVGQLACELGTNHCSVGAHSLAPRKVILLMGKTGVGKTTIANWLLNYVYGVEFTDDYRFQLIAEKATRTRAASDTDKVTSYTIYHQPGMKIPYSLTIVDTPGFQSTLGLKADQRIRKQLEEYFGVSEADEIVSHIHAVCILVTAATQKLTASEEYVFECIKQIFGADIEENISIFFTFADHCRPSAGEVVDRAGMPYGTTFKFNNGDVLKVHVPDEEGDDDYNMLSKWWWEKREKQTRQFLETLERLPARTSTLTKKTLDERGKVDRAVNYLEMQIKSELNELQTLTDMQKVVMENAREINNNISFKVSVQMECPVTELLKDDSRATNCPTCKFTCHVPCATIDRWSREHCDAMTNGMCTRCPGKCSFRVHTAERYAYKRELKTMEWSSERLLEEFDKAVENIMKSPSTRSEQIYRHIEDALKTEVLQNIAGKVNEIQESLNTLDRVALARVPQDASRYIDMLINREESRGENGYENRVKHLRDERYKQQILRLINSGRCRPSAEGVSQ